MPAANAIPVTYKGKTYASVGVLAEKVGLKEATLRARLAKGWDVDRAVLTKAGVSRGKAVLYKGTRYATEGDLAEAHGVNRGAFLRRRKQGATIADALKMKSRRSIAVKFQGVVYPSSNHLARAFGITPNNYQARIRNGWTRTEALGLSSRKNKVSDECKNGKVYKITCRRTRKHYIGLTTKTLQTRLRQHIVNSRTLSNSNLSRAIREHGETTFTIELLATADNRKELSRLEKHYVEVYDTLRNGYNSVPAGSLGSGVACALGQEIKFRGKTYPSLSALCRKFGVGRSTFEMRYKKQGQSLEQALGLAV